LLQSEKHLQNEIAIKKFLLELCQLVRSVWI
jgi:hypothetical protein